MTAGEILIVLATLSAALLLSEGLLAALGLHRVHVSGFTWLVIVGATLGGQQWAVASDVLSSGAARGAGLAVVAVVTAAWFNDHGPHARRPKRTRPVAAPLTRPAPASAGEQPDRVQAAPAVAASAPR